MSTQPGQLQVRINYEDHPFNADSLRWLPFVVVPHWNWRAQAEYGTYGDGSYKHCYPGSSTRCVQVAWWTKPFAFQKPAIDTVGSSWVGTLIKEKLDATGTYYRRIRYIDPSTGRFTQEDPIGLAGGANLYGFANGDPVNLSDPFGLCPVCLIYIAFEVASGGYDIYETYKAFKRSRAEGMEALHATFFGAIAPGPGNAYRKAFNALDELSSAARAIDRGGLTRAGRALTKHARGQRAGSELFPALSGDVDDINRVAGQIVDDILTDPKSTAVVIKRGRFKGGVDIYDSRGRGVRYDAEGNFVTFLERQTQ